MKHCPRPLRVKHAGRLAGVVIGLMIALTAAGQSTSIRDAVNAASINATDAPSVAAKSYVMASLDHPEKMSSAARSVLASLLSSDNTAKSAGSISRLSDRFALHTNSGIVEADVLVSFASTPDPSLLVSMGGNVSAVTERIVAARIPVTSIATLASDVSIEYIDISRRMYPMYHNAGLHVSQSTLDVKAIKHAADRAGDGVIIGIVDTGIDHTHPDLNGGEGTGILRLWDMSDVDNANAPADFNWGREYTKEEIDASPDQVIQLDGNGGFGHGTHVTGVAGSIAPLDSAGVVVPANLVIVKAVRGVESEGGFSEADVLAGIDYIFKQAEALGKPAVVNLSMGHYDGPLDGTSLFDQAISDMLGPGRLIVVAAGNGGYASIHAGTTTTSETIYEAFLEARNADNAYVNLWYSPEALSSVSLAYYDASGAEPVLLGMTDPLLIGQDLGSDVPMPVTFDGSTLGYVSIDATNLVDGNNGDGQISISLTNNGDEGIDLQQTLWSVVTNGSSDGRQDMWAMGGAFKSESLSQGDTVQLYGNSDQTIASPATAEGVIAVGSFVSQNQFTNIYGLAQDWLNPTLHGEPVRPELGQRSYFSGIGPTRDGRMLPDIMAPGEVVLSMLSSHLTIGDGYLGEEVAEGGNYRAFEGTSVAAANVTSVAAQMLEAYPELNPITFKFLLQDTAIPDFQTGSVPNNEFGAGKIDGPAAIQRAADLGNSSASAQLDRVGISFGVPPGIEGKAQFVLQNTGNSDLDYELIFDDPVLGDGASKTASLSNIRTDAIDTAPRPAFDDEAIAAFKREVEGVATAKDRRAVSYPITLGENVLMHDDGNHTPDTFWGFGEVGKKVFWGNQYILNDFDFTIEKIQFYTRTESLDLNILWVGIFRGPTSLQLFGGQLFGIEANEDGQWYEIELETPISFKQGSGFFIELTASDSLLFPVAVDYAAATNSRSYFATTGERYANINTLTSSGIEQGAMLVRAIGTASRNVNLSPVASAVLSTMTAIQGEVITFDASPSEDPDGELVSVTWDFGDGETSDQIEATHAYMAPGEYEVKLIVKDDAEAESVARGKVTVMAADPLSAPRFVVAPASGTIPPGGSQVFDVSFDTEDLEEGVYNGHIDVSTNAGYLTLPVNIEVSQTYVSNEEEQIQPDQVRLDQNFPNPFKPETVIAYYLPEAYDVTLEVYDTMGRRVGILDRGTKSPGRYEVQWNASDEAGNRVASGIYFYRLVARSTAGQSEVQLHKKMILLR